MGAAGHGLSISTKVADAAAVDVCGDDNVLAMELSLFQWLSTTTSKQTAPRNPTVGLSRRLGLLEFVAPLRGIASLLKEGVGINERFISWMGLISSPVASPFSP